MQSNFKKVAGKPVDKTYRAYLSQYHRQVHAELVTWFRNLKRQLRTLPGNSGGQVLDIHFPTGPSNTWTWMTITFTRLPASVAGMKLTEFHDRSALRIDIDMDSDRIEHDKHAPYIMTILRNDLGSASTRKELKGELIETKAITSMVADFIDSELTRAKWMQTDLQKITRLKIPARSLKL